MRRRSAFTLVEVLVVIGIIAVLLSILIPVTGKVRAAARATQCASNLRQIGLGLMRYFNDYKHLPVRDNSGDLTLATSNPHVFKFWESTDNVSELMEKYVGSKQVLYCPANSIGRDPEHWWPAESGTIATSYQYPFWLYDSWWVIPKPDYRRLTSERVLAADYLGCILRTTGEIQIVAWNHEKLQDGSPRGMNMLFGDGHVEWRKSENRWQLWGATMYNVYWFWANPN